MSLAMSFATISRHASRAAVVLVVGLASALAFACSSTVDTECVAGAACSCADCAKTCGGDGKQCSFACTGGNCFVLVPGWRLLGVVDERHVGDPRLPGRRLLAQLERHGAELGRVLGHNTAILTELGWSTVEIDALNASAAA